MALERAFGELGRIGYDDVEICISNRYVVATLEQIAPVRRKQLAACLEDNGLGVPALIITGHLHHEDRKGMGETVERLRVCGQPARALGAGMEPVPAVGFAGHAADWETIKDRMAEQLDQYGAVAEEEGFVLAGEAHCTEAGDRSERVGRLLGAEKCYRNLRRAFEQAGVERW